MIADVVIAVVVALVTGAFFFWLGRQSNKQDIQGLKEFITKLIPYQQRLSEALRQLEGKNVEDEGRIVVDRNDDGSPIRVRTEPPQTSHLEPLELNAELGNLNVEVGPAPPPPPIHGWGADVRLHQRPDANNVESEEQDSTGNQ
jgi:hypothetical protein